MCGIFGIISTFQNQDLYTIIINGLIQLQNRGYDSSGICLLNNDSFEVHKYASTNEQSSIDKLLQLKSNIDIKNQMISLGIGHNRWATHGAKNDINAHPHISNDKRFVLVHNGIIENYQVLKSFLIKNDYEFYSQTDTEVIVNLISYYYQMEKNVFIALKKTINEIQGTYGIILMNLFEPHKMYAVRNGSPLLVGITDEYSIITSEQSGFCNMVNNYITLQNDDICIIEKIKIKTKETYTLHIETSNHYIHKKVTITNHDLTPEPYKHWTLKEINDQPNTIFNAMNRGGRIKNEREVKLGGLEEKIDLLKNIKNIILLGCGTSYHAGLYGAYYLKTLCNFNTVQVIDGAELNEYDIPQNSNTAFVLISQSGETKDLHRCIEIAKKRNIITIGIINVVDSLIAREVDCGIYCNAGREMGVASTKAFTSQVICLSMLAIWYAQINNINEMKRIQMIRDLHNISNDFKNVLYQVNQQIKDIVLSGILNINNLFLLGKGTDEFIAKEGSLKIKEISYIHSEGYSASSLKHGPFALLDEDFPTILLNCHEEHTSKIINCFEEVHSRKSPILFITNNNIDIQKDCIVIKITKNYTYSSLLAIIPLQLLAYYLSIQKGINPDIPKNLAKVVTVE
jgi:glucosamine--fructose-6-phosphate aminotransferase (isomerizing)